MNLANLRRRVLCPITSNSTTILGSLPEVSIFVIVPTPNVLCLMMHPSLISLRVWDVKPPEEDGVVVAGLAVLTGLKWEVGVVTMRVFSSSNRLLNGCGFS